jgi:hypothetical protein
MKAHFKDDRGDKITYFLHEHGMQQKISGELKKRILIADDKIMHSIILTSNPNHLKYWKTLIGSPYYHNEHGKQDLHTTTFFSKMSLHQFFDILNVRF